MKIIRVCWREALWGAGWALGLLSLLCGAQLVAASGMRDEAGRWVRVPDRPRRIVSLAPSITECLFALGIDQAVVGVTRFSNYPPQVHSRPKVGSYKQINLEKILSLNPDLVLATRDGNPRDRVLRLAEMGVPVYVVDPRDFEGLFRTLETLGEILGRRDRARTLVEGLKARLRAIVSRLTGRPRPRVLLQVGIDPLVTVGKGTLQDRLIDLAGGRNIAAGQSIPYPALSIERVLVARPEVILVSSMVGKTDAARELQRWLQWPMIPAVAARRLHVIDGDLIDRPSPRILLGLEEMAALIHPEAAEELKNGGSTRAGSWK